MVVTAPKVVVVATCGDDDGEISQSNDMVVTTAHAVVVLVTYGDDDCVMSQQVV